MEQDGIGSQVLAIERRHKAESGWHVDQPRRVPHARAHEAGLEGDALAVGDTRLRIEHVQGERVQRAIHDVQHGVRGGEVARRHDARIGRQIAEDDRQLLQADPLHRTSVYLECEVLVQHSLLQ